ncbi:MAG: cation-transporting P-type ATPase, partial [Nitrososphaerales archaeon]
MQNAHAHSGDEVLSLLKTNRESGLSLQDAKERLSQYGRNRLEEEKGASALRILAAQLSNVLIVILLAATVVSAFLGEFVDAIVIIIIVALVAALGFAQEYRTERVLAALKKMQDHTVSVVRGGEVTEIGVEEIVPGDIILV